MLLYSLKMTNAVTIASYKAEKASQSFPFLCHLEVTILLHACARGHRTCAVWLHMVDKFIIPPRSMNRPNILTAPSGLVSIFALYTSRKWNIINITWQGDYIYIYIYIYVCVCVLVKSRSRVRYAIYTSAKFQLVPEGSN